MPVINDKGRNILIYLYKKLYIVNNLRAKILIRNNIIRPEDIIINIARKTARIRSYKVTTTITVK